MLARCYEENFAVDAITADLATMRSVAKHTMILRSDRWIRRDVASHQPCERIVNSLRRRRVIFYRIEPGQRAAARSSAFALTVSCVKCSVR